MNKQELKALWEYAETLPKGSKTYEEVKQILIKELSKEVKK